MPQDDYKPAAAATVNADQHTIFHWPPLVHRTFAIVSHGTDGAS